MLDREYREQPDSGTIVIEEERLKEGYTLIPNTILKRPELSPGAKLTYIVLLSYAHQKDSCFPGQLKLAKDMGAGERSVRRYLGELQDSGLLRVKRRGLGYTNIYTLAKWVESRAANLADQERPKTTVLKRPNWPREEYQEEELQEQQHVGVVAHLTEFGITKAAAERLAASYPEDYILKKLDLVQWLVEIRSKLVGKNPAGYLRRAVEDDYQPPPGYESAEARAEKERLKTERQREEQAMRVRLEETFQIARAATRKTVDERFPDSPISGTSHTTRILWRQALAQLEGQMSPANFQTWLKDTSLVFCDTKMAVIVGQTKYQVKWLSQRFDPLVSKALYSFLGYRISCRFATVSELENVSAPSHELEHVPSQPAPPRQAPAPPQTLF